MFGSIGMPEILLILVIALLIFGPKRLPEVGRTIGRGLSEFRRASTDLKRTLNAELSLEDDEARPAAPRRPPTTRRLEGETAPHEEPPWTGRSAGDPETPHAVDSRQTPTPPTSPSPSPSPTPPKPTVPVPASGTVARESAAPASTAPDDEPVPAAGSTAP